MGERKEEEGGAVITAIFPPDAFGIGELKSVATAELAGWAIPPLL